MKELKILFLIEGINPDDQEHQVLLADLLVNRLTRYNPDVSQTDKINKSGKTYIALESPAITGWITGTKIKISAKNADIYSWLDAYGRLCQALARIAARADIKSHDESGLCHLHERDARKFALKVANYIKKEK